MLTDNNVLVSKLVELPALMCVQKKADKCIQTEDIFIESNIASFGNEIGQVTNWITSMYELSAKFDSDSEGRRTLEYRIKAGQLFQQNTMELSCRFCQK